MIDRPKPDGVRQRLRVFLSGRIDGVDLEEASRWRQLATLRLSEEGFDVYDPTRVMRDSCDYRSIANEVFTNDRWNLARCDLVLVNLTLPDMVRSRDVPFFTIGEMFLAHQAGLPLIVFGSCLEGRPGYDAIVTRSFAALDEAIRYIVATYGAACVSPGSALP
jgi:hypothetical protein